MTEPPLDLDAIKAIGRDAAYIAVRYPLRVRGKTILAKADLLALVERLEAAEQQAERYREAAHKAAVHLCDTADHARCDLCGRMWEIAGHATEPHNDGCALAEPAPEDGR